MGKEKIDLDLKKMIEDLKSVAEMMGDERYNNACILIGIVIGKLSQKIESKIEELKNDPTKSI